VPARAGSTDPFDDADAIPRLQLRPAASDLNEWRNIAITLIDYLASTLIWVTFVSVGDFSTRYFSSCYAILRTQRVHDNEIPLSPLPMAQKDGEID
jgi:hypothetical protein